MEATQPFWDADGFGPSMYTDGPIERVFAPREHDKSIRFLRVWINGTGGDLIDQLPANEVGTFVVRELEKMRPAAKGKLRPRLHYSWNRETYIGGHKHVYLPGQVVRFAAQIDRPWQRVHFAGEHLRRMEFGLESAMETTERAVSAILTA
jgi:monoamine oxidase